MKKVLKSFKEITSLANKILKFYSVFFCFRHLFPAQLHVQCFFPSTCSSVKCKNKYFKMFIVQCTIYTVGNAVYGALCSMQCGVYCVVCRVGCTV